MSGGLTKVFIIPMRGSLVDSAWKFGTLCRLSCATHPFLGYFRYSLKTFCAIYRFIFLLGTGAYCDDTSLTVRF